MLLCICAASDYKGRLSKSMILSFFDTIFFIIVRMTSYFCIVKNLINTYI